MKLKKRYYIRPISKRKQTEHREYLKLARDFLQRHQKCWVYPKLQATQVHHTEGRGANLLRVETWMAVSNQAHFKIHHVSPKWARSKGYLPAKCGEETIKDYGNGIEEKHWEILRATHHDDRQCV